jgi:putative sterol carrier protein
VQLKTQSLANWTSQKQIEHSAVKKPGELLISKKQLGQRSEKKLVLKTNPLKVVVTGVKTQLANSTKKGDLY